MDSIATGQSSQSKASEDVVLELEYEMEEDLEAELEDFVRLSHSGQFKDAHELYDECLSAHDSWYPIAAEYADCLLREGDFQQLVTFSRKAAMRFQDPSERTLLHLMEVIGSRAPNEIMWQQLRNLWPVGSMKPPYNLLSDTDVHLLEIGLQILVLTGEDPKDLDARLDSDHTMFGPYGAFQDLYFYLLHHEFFWEAQRILHSLLHKVSLFNCGNLVNDYIEKAVSTNIGQESVQIATSSLVQRFVYVVKRIHSSPLALVRWNDAIHWALFGVTLAGAGEESISLVSRICMRPYLRQCLKYNRLPLDGVNSGNDDMFESLNEAVKNGDVSMMRQAVIAEPIRYTEDELNSMILLKAAQHFFLRERKQLFLNPRTVDARDGFWRTSLHWASLNADLQAVELLLSKGEADACLLDWFGCMPLHYAVRSRAMKRENIRVVESLLKSDSATVNTRDSSGRTPLRIAILSQTYEMAETLLRHGATVETSDYSVLLLPQLDKSKIDPQSERKELSEWQELLSRYDLQRYLHPSFTSSNSSSATKSWSGQQDPIEPDILANHHYQRHKYPPVSPADQNPPCNTLYVGNLPIDSSEDELKAIFSTQKGYKSLCFRTKQNGPMCFVEFEDMSFATKALNELYGYPLHNSTKGGIRLSFSKNPLGLRTDHSEASDRPSHTWSSAPPITSRRRSLFSTKTGFRPGKSAQSGLGASIPPGTKHTELETQDWLGESDVDSL